MKLFVFTPSKNWSYSGGALIVSGKDLDEAKETVKRYVDRINERRRKEEWFSKHRINLLDIDPTDDTSDDWVLRFVFESPSVTKSVVYLHNLHEG